MKTTIVAVTIAALASFGCATSTTDSPGEDSCAPVREVVAQMEELREQRDAIDEQKPDITAYPSDKSLPDDVVDEYNANVDRSNEITDRINALDARWAKLLDQNPQCTQTGGLK